MTNAIDSGNPEAVAWVLSKNPQINYVDDEGFTVLMSALQVEIDCRLPPDEASALTIRLVDLLCDAGADINLTATLGSTALHTAAAWSSPTVVRHLLSRGADPHAADWDYVPEKPAAIAKSKKRWEVHAILCQAMGMTPAGRPE
ncbi:ankyrin repeat domain-containing protein [Defluviimonas sp. WL0024]|uniref:Ankyrin repeat domain-containing protein n=1 Tax=Albidovulum salinarum TaxID=2984153 RepID=A0ABT2X7H0_9RHOB|nr:ankyrin repeat domain-containing protein [Defluviimonas sp. WL0024]MCU9849897.1 ankyrin repeat domain-containing protein [Defluviimonas sp. WL0024]